MARVEELQEQLAKVAGHEADSKESLGAQGSQSPTSSPASSQRDVVSEDEAVEETTIPGSLLAQAIAQQSAVQEQQLYNQKLSTINFAPSVDGHHPWAQWANTLVSARRTLNLEESDSATDLLARYGIVATAPTLAAEFQSLQQRTLSVGALAQYFANQGLSEVPRAKLKAACINFASKPDPDLDCTALEQSLGSLAQRAQVDELEKATYLILACVNGGLISVESADPLYQKISSKESAVLSKTVVYSQVAQRLHTMAGQKKTRAWASVTVPFPSEETTQRERAGVYFVGSRAAPQGSTSKKEAPRSYRKVTAGGGSYRNEYSGRRRSRSPPPSPTVASSPPTTVKVKIQPSPWA